MFVHVFILLYLEADFQLWEDLCGVALRELSSNKELNQMTFEIVGMLLSDNEFYYDKQWFLPKVASKFSISDKTIE